MKLIIPTRSPFYFNQPVNQFTASVSFEVEVIKKTPTGTETVQTETITKLMPISTFENLWADVSPIIRDFYSHSPIDLTTLQAGGIIRSRNDEILRATISVTQNVTAGASGSSQSTYFCLDGYSKHEQGQNWRPDQNILLSHSSYKMAEDGYFIVPLWVEAGNSNPTINGSGVTLLSLDSPLDALQYLIIRGSDYTGDVTVAYEGEEILIELETACKYPVYDVQFINKFGVLESFEFRGVSQSSISVEKKTFINSYTDGVSYDVNRHQMRDFQKFGNKKISIESDFLTEGYNETIEELMLSEQIWLRQGASLRPINIDSSSLTYKTRVIDKLIAYKLSFKYAHNVINNI